VWDESENFLNEFFLIASVLNHPHAFLNINRIILIENPVQVFPSFAIHKDEPVAHTVRLGVRASVPCKTTWIAHVTNRTNFSFAF
jgi:hypothetical protein